MKWRWKFVNDQHGTRLKLVRGRAHAATVYLHWDFSGFNWCVWDKAGVGGENWKERTVADAIKAATQAAIRWGQFEGLADGERTT